MFGLGLSSILFELFKKIFYSKTALTILLGVVLTLFATSKLSSLKETVGGWFGQKSVPELKAEIQEQKKTIENLVEENRGKDVQMGIQDDVHKATVDAVTVVGKKDKEITAAVTTTQAKKKEALGKLEKTNLPVEELVVMESEVVYDSIVSVYTEMCKKTNCEGVAS